MKQPRSAAERARHAPKRNEEQKRRARVAAGLIRKIDSRELLVQYDSHNTEPTLLRAALADLRTVDGVSEVTFSACGCFAEWGTDHFGGQLTVGVEHNGERFIFERREQRFEFVELPGSGHAPPTP